MAAADAPTVLVVDDDPGIVQTFARILELGGYGVRTAMNAEMALHQFDLGHPDVVLLDLRLPRVDGLSVLRSLRAREGERHIPVGIITGDYTLDDAMRLELFGLGAALYFKPVWFEDLLGITRDLLDKAH